MGVNSPQSKYMKKYSFFKIKDTDKIHEIDTIKSAILTCNHEDDIIWIISQYPWSALLIRNLNKKMKMVACSRDRKVEEILDSESDISYKFKDSHDEVYYMCETGEALYGSEERHKVGQE